ncbi:hypothetical protein KEJ27_06510 [Candidatus Bathyarchaeota archaeon]|nr:hypothetical protein [Candidatus Bathyarchaeota archaeon]MBS7612761.1 hypothetical protein [Candidatus Bathyarchaeota archaeon]MBS7618321.1 hypothetical protein [Candidatus Bathyarchaeota archaeon]
MRKFILILGLIMLIVGAIILSYSFEQIRRLDALIKTDEWFVTHYSLKDEYGTFGEVTASSTFPAKFKHQLSPAVWGGFKASLTVELLQEATVIFRIDSNGGIIFSVDGSAIISMWYISRIYDHKEQVQLAPGVHKLELYWYGYGGEITFDMYVEGRDAAANLQWTGLGVFFIGVAITSVGFVLKRKTSVKIKTDSKLTGNSNFN